MIARRGSGASWPRRARAAAFVILLPLLVIIAPAPTPATLTTAATPAVQSAAVVDVFALMRDDAHGRRYRAAVRDHLNAVILPPEAFDAAMRPPRPGARGRPRGAAVMDGALDWLATQELSVYAARLVDLEPAAPARAGGDDDAEPPAGGAEDFLGRVMLTRGRVADWELVHGLGRDDEPALSPRQLTMIARQVRQLDPQLRLWVHDLVAADPARLARFTARLDNLLAEGCRVDGISLTVRVEADDPATAAATLDEAIDTLHERYGLPLRILGLMPSDDLTDDVVADIAASVVEVVREATGVAGAGVESLGLGVVWAGQRHGQPRPAMLSETWAPTPVADALGLAPDADPR
ncbi:MAG: hypothetical protein WD316_08615 [Phycisphaeraceae bacterium]